MGTQMNPIIKEFAEQASHQSPDGYPVILPYNNDFAVKFAQLLTDDFLSICSQEMMKNKYNDEIIYSTIQGIIRKVIAKYGDVPK